MRTACAYVALISAATLGGCAADAANPCDAVVRRYADRLAAREAPPRAEAPADDAGGWRPLLDEPVAGTTEVCLFALVDAGGGTGDDAPAPGRKRETAPGWGKGKPGQLEYVPWRRRVGRAYPDHFWPSLGRWGQEMPATLWDDTVSIVEDRFSLALLAAAGISGAAIASSQLDDRTERHYTRHGSQLGDDLDGIGGFFGNPALHLPAAFASVLVATATEDEQFYEDSTTMLNALCVNGMVVQGLKWAFLSESPNGDENGWPSGHSSSTFCVATVLYHQHGPWVGVPLLGFATFVAYQRVDARNHDLSDVVSGSLIGIAIGHAVAGNHEVRIFGMDVVPYVDPNTGTVGVALVKSF